jgi:hypothetical protein
MTLTDHRRSNQRTLTNEVHAPASEASTVVIPQYSRRSILAVRAVAAVPIVVLSWIAALWMASSTHEGSPLLRALLVRL